MAEPNENKEGGEGSEQSPGLLQESPPARTLLLHNAALRQNFEQLKQLFMKLSEANISLQETCRRLQLEKKLQPQVYGSVTSIKTEELPAILSSKENDALMKEIDVLRLERDQAMEEKEAIELEYIKLLSLRGEETDIREKAGNLADKCKHLEIDLETACVAGEAAHGQLLKVAYEKDVIILELEKAVQKLQDKAKCTEISQTLKSEIGDLHGMLDAMERATQDAELRHANAIDFVKEMDWELEREKLFETNDRDTQDRFAKLMKQNHALKKRLKQSYQVLASLTCDCNKLKEELKAKSTLTKEEKIGVEEAPTDAVTSSERQCSKYAHFGERREELAVPTSRRRPLHLDMNHLAQRQMRLLDSLVAT